MQFDDVTEELMSTDVSTPFDDWSKSQTFMAKQTVDVFSYDETGMVIMAGLVFPFGLFGIFANGVTIYVICKSPRLKSIFNYFILSLATSDLISALLSPLTVYHRTWGASYWRISTFLCKVFWAGIMGTSVLTSLHITVYSALRFVSLKWPHKFRRYTIRHAKLTVMCLWIISFFSGSVPFLIWMAPLWFDRSKLLFAQAIPACGVMIKWFPYFMAYTIYGYSLLFFLPCLLVFIFSGGASVLICIRQIQRKRSNQRRAGAPPNEGELIRQRKENQAIAQLLLICGSFLFGYVPFCVCHIFTAFSSRETRSNLTLMWWVGALPVILMQFSEFLNPIFYNLASRDEAAIRKRKNPDSFSSFPLEFLLLSFFICFLSYSTKQEQLSHHLVQGRNKAWVEVELPNLWT